MQRTAETYIRIYRGATAEICMLNLAKSFIWILRGETAVPHPNPHAGFVSACLLIFRYSLNYWKIEPFIFLDRDSTSIFRISFPSLVSSIFHFHSLASSFFTLEESFFRLTVRSVNSLLKSKKEHVAVEIQLLPPHCANPLPWLIFIWLRDQKRGCKRSKVTLKSTV